ncbi:TPA: hypothetical protein ACK3JR_000253, partial [Mannheimia haemolytica]
APQNKYFNLFIDTTFFAGNLILWFFMDTCFKKVIYYQIIETEKNIYYKESSQQTERKRLYYSIGYL